MQWIVALPGQPPELAGESEAIVSTLLQRLGARQTREVFAQP